TRCLSDWSSDVCSSDLDLQLPRPRYLKHAIEDQHNVVFLLGAACFSLAFASPVPFLVGLGGELLWLVIGPRLPAFRDWVDGQQRSEERRVGKECGWGGS